MSAASAPADVAVTALKGTFPSPLVLGDCKAAVGDFRTGVGDFRAGVGDFRAGVDFLGGITSSQALCFPLS